jgi:hypothetical protein
VKKFTAKALPRSLLRVEQTSTMTSRTSIAMRLALPGVRNVHRRARVRIEGVTVGAAAVPEEVVAAAEGVVDRAVAARGGADDQAAAAVQGTEAKA